MTERCIGPEALGEILEAAEDDPRRRHAESCPRCRALLTAYRDFINPGDEPGGADPAGAEVRMAAALEREMAPGAGASRRVARPRTLLGRFFQPAVFRPRWAAVAAAVVIAGIVLVRQLTVGGGDGSGGLTFRGEGWRQETEIVHGAQVSGDGSITVRWRPHSEADVYSVRLYAPDLTELARFDGVSDTLLVIAPGDVPRQAGSVLIWRVVALRGGQEIQKSPATTLKLP